jgi:Leucine-rich repeat (LRR) protein
MLKVPGEVAPELIEELDFSNCNLTFLDLRKYKNLKKLSVARNQLKTLEGSHFFSF